MKFPEKANLQRQKADQWLPGTRWDQRLTENKKLFEVMEMFLNWIVVINAQLYKFTKNHSMLKMGTFYGMSIVPQ